MSAVYTTSRRRSYAAVKNLFRAVSRREFSDYHVAQGDFCGRNCVEIIEAKTRLTTRPRDGDIKHYVHVYSLVIISEVGAIDLSICTPSEIPFLMTRRLSCNEKFLQN